MAVRLGKNPSRKFSAWHVINLVGGEDWFKDRPLHEPSRNWIRDADHSTIKAYFLHTRFGSTF